MALTYDNISAITSKKWLPKLYDNIFDSNILLKKLREKSYMKVDGGTSIMVPLNYAVDSASNWFQGSATLDVSNYEMITAAEYNWKQIYAAISVSRIEELKNSGDAAILNLVKAKMQVAEKTLADSLGTGLYNSGTDANAITGLRFPFANNNTVGGIPQSTFTWWNTQGDSTTTTLTLNALQAQFNSASIDTDKPDIITATRSNFNRFWSLLQPQQRFSDSKSASAGFENLLFNGTPFYTDAKCPANYINLLNSKYLHLIVHPDEDFRQEPFAKPINQAVKVSKIFWGGAFGFSNLRLLGNLSAITA